jgi:hypothetical protein
MNKPALKSKLALQNLIAKIPQGEAQRGNGNACRIHLCSPPAPIFLMAKSIIQERIAKIGAGLLLTLPLLLSFPSLLRWGIPNVSATPLRLPLLACFSCGGLSSSLKGGVLSPRVNENE